MGATRMNITLPADVVKILKQKTKPGEKSAFIADAVRSYAKGVDRQKLIEEMIEGYKARADEDRAIANDWEPTEDED